MQIVIDIPDEDYYRIKYMPDAYKDREPRIYMTIRKGTPIPKGHGRLIDADALIFNADYWEPYISKLDFDNAPTIIEADKR